MKDYPAKQKIVIAGNHDISLDFDYYKNIGCNRFHGNCKQLTTNECIVLKNELKKVCTYLEDTSCKSLGNYNVYGSPWQPEFCNWGFNAQRGQGMKLILFI